MTTRTTRTKKAISKIRSVISHFRSEDCLETPMKVKMATGLEYGDVKEILNFLVDIEILKAVKTKDKNDRYHKERYCLKTYNPNTMKRYLAKDKDFKWKDKEKDEELIIKLEEKENV